tara:strand:- start:502 stop:948 length:447 start_codon:yes stop_codon:yes gene_type:complete
MARDSYVFDSDRKKIALAEQHKAGSVAYNYKSISQLVNNVKNFLGSEECSLTRKRFGLIISELVNNNKESNKLFDAAFKCLIKHLINHRNKIIVKLIIKLVIPTWVLKYHATRKTSQHMGGVETTASAKDALNKIRLSVLTFRKCCDR